MHYGVPGICNYMTLHRGGTGIPWHQYYRNYFVCYCIRQQCTPHTNNVFLIKTFNYIQTGTYRKHAICHTRIHTRWVAHMVYIRTTHTHLMHYAQYNTNSCLVDYSLDITRCFYAPCLFSLCTDMIHYTRGAQQCTSQWCFTGRRVIST